MLEAVDATVTSVEKIIAATGMPVEGVLERLMELEIDGLVGAHRVGTSGFRRGGRTGPMSATYLLLASSRGRFRFERTNFVMVRGET